MLADYQADKKNAAKLYRVIEAMGSPPSPVVIGNQESTRAELAIRLPELVGIGCMNLLGAADSVCVQRAR